MKRLLVEELDRREMPSGKAKTATTSAGLASNSRKDFEKAREGTENDRPGGVCTIDQDIDLLLGDLAVVDAALAELFCESDEGSVAKTQGDAAPLDVAEQATS